MKMTRLNRIVQIAATLGIMSYGSIASAHWTNDALGATASATDYWTVACPAGSLSLQSAVADTTAANGSKVSVLIAKNLISAKSSTDATEGDVTNDGTWAGYSPVIVLNGGASTTYGVFVTHSAASADNYRLAYHCMQNADGTGAEFAPTIVNKQQQ